MLVDDDPRSCTRSSSSSASLHFDRLAGTDRLRWPIEDGQLDEFLATWDGDEAKFRATREPYLLYE